MTLHTKAASTPLTPVRQRSLIADNPSPATPSSTASSPYTAISSHGLSPPSSTLSTPSSLKLSPTPTRHGRPTKSIADLAENWRVRAQLNGIKVSAVDGPSKDEGSSINVCAGQCLNGMPLVPGSPSGFPDSICHKSSPFVSPSHASRRFISYPHTPSNTAGTKHALRTFTSPRRSASYDPFSDASEDEADDRLKSAPPVFKNLSSLCSSLQASLRSSCSVCDKEPSGLSRMIVLSPCSHIFCSSCFTGTLNIVGEKNMSCMECRSPVDNFHFALPRVSDSESSPAASLGNPFEESVPITTSSKSGLFQRNAREKMAVLRIDNVPWDVTPLIIKKFIKHPIVQAHVLLDAKGKTLSHAFVQLLPENARAALRSSQNAILGQGRRARAVTVTLSSQTELMTAIYPHWRGSFDGCRPSLDGLDNQQVNEALRCGLMSNAELNSLFDLITTPDSHFLKVPSLPFWSLISILSTFPADVDSRVFWSCKLRDALFRVTHAALENLQSRKDSEEYMVLWNQLVAASTGCKAFTTSQKLKLQLLVVDTSLVNSSVSVSTPKPCLESSEKLVSLAEQFGLEPGVLAAILQSLA